MKVYKVTPGEGLEPCIETEPSAAISWLECAEIGDVITIEIKEMTEAEFEALPEYRGP